MSDSPQPDSSPRFRWIGYLLIPITILLVGYFIYISAAPGSPLNQLTESEAKLIENMRSLDEPDKLDALANAPEYFYQSVLKDIPEPLDGSDSALERVLREMSSAEPDADRIAGLVRQIEIDKMETAIKALLLSDEDKLTELAVWLAIELAQSEPEAALRLADDFPTEKDWGHITVNAVWKWARKDPDTAYDWVAKRLNTVRRSAHYVFLEMTRDKPEEAYRKLRLISNHHTQLQGGRGVIKALAEAKQPDTRAMVDFIMDQPESIRSNLVYNLFSNYLESDPTEPVVELAQALAARDAELAQKAYGWWAGEYAEDHPKASAEWSLQLANPEDRSRTLEPVIREWARNDLKAASTWLKEQPNEPVYDYGRYALVRELSKKSPQQAIPWAESTVDAKLRYRALYLAASQWAKASPEEAIAYVQATSHLSEVQRKQALERLERYPRKPKRD
ncbi:hypothetical protein DDZ13_03800 [Coraliomargarita sinensis]|uniref:Uncharacterized protein n=1 Tax=Coraliomargarita sinensis TaxID=2174842 RepID=A0A317ZLP7_9BACT|nr:hypothetical protein [Coraliomargarita sinensis]PXA05097.1 hypothetical protein DDZ13_03800 [Coraliomargarita sinensis]